MPTPHPIHRRWLAEDFVRLRRADERRRGAASQRHGRIDPNPHQIDAVVFALGRIRDGGCILADEVGLGKTIEAGLVIVQLLAEGARRVLIVVPKPLQGQWQQELYRLFGVEVRDGAADGDEALVGDGVFLVGRDWAGGDRGSERLRSAEPFDLCVIDEAHEIFAGLYKRYDRHGVYQPASPKAQMAGRVKELLVDTPVLLLTATPIQNSLAELWGLVQYVEPTGTLLGDVSTFRQLFCDGDDRKLAPGQDEELRRRLGTVVKRTLRRQAQEFLERPFVDRRAQLFEYRMSGEERSLYDDLTLFLMRPRLAAFRGNHRRLLLIAFHRQMASSVQALAASLRKVAARLERMLAGAAAEELEAGAADLVDDLEDEMRQTERDEGEAPTAAAIRAELADVRDFIARAEALPRDSKAEALVRAVRLVLERAAGGEGSGKIVIFTESLTTQEYLRRLLTGAGGLADDDVTLFRGTNTGERTTAALERWKSEVGDKIAPYQRPSRAVALRLALVHEFETRSRVFIATEAGAKGLNLQFCDTLLNYDLLWNPQRIEQRIGRCHRYSQEHDVTVINFLAADNEAQKLTFDILSRKLDLFGTVLDASDEVLYEPRTRAPETLAGALAADFENRLERIYERARTPEERVEKLRRLRQTMGDERQRYEEELARTEKLIESRFDEEVRRSFRRIRDELPATLDAFDRDADRLLRAYLAAAEVPHERRREEGCVRYSIAPSRRLPEDLAEGLEVVVGKAPQLGDADGLYLGHPLLAAAVAEARAASDRRFRVALTVPRTAPDELGERRGGRGRLVVLKVRYRGFEPVERLLPVAVLEPDGEVLAAAAAAALVALAARDRDDMAPPAVAAEDLEDAVEEALFLDQGEVAAAEERRFERTLAQIERFLDDRTMVLARRRRGVEKSLRQALHRRDTVLGAEGRSEAEARARTLQHELDELEAEIRRLEARQDPDYEKWRRRAHRRRYAPPTVERILEVDFELV